MQPWIEFPALVESVVDDWPEGVCVDGDVDGD
jgi:hypothetical protein